MISSDYKIDLANYGDAQAIAELSREDIEYGLIWNYTPQKIIKCIKSKTRNVAVVRENGFFAGFGIMSYGEDKANLDLLAIKNKYRGKGAGQSVVKWLIHVASTAGIFNIYVQLRENNTNTLKFYEQLGFVTIEKIYNYYQGREDAIIMLNHTAVSGRNR